MSLARAIYERWQADGRLAQLVPGARVFSGRAAGDVTLPYAVITEMETQRGMHTTHSAIETARFEFSAWVEQLADARRLLEELRRCYDRQSFVFGAVRCLLMQSEEERIAPEENGCWRAMAIYRMTHERAAAAAP